MNCLLMLSPIGFAGDLALQNHCNPLQSNMSKGCTPLCGASCALLLSRPAAVSPTRLTTPRRALLPWPPRPEQESSGRCVRLPIYAKHPTTPNTPPHPTPHPSHHHPCRTCSAPTSGTSHPPPSPLQNQFSLASKAKQKLPRDAQSRDLIDRLPELGAHMSRVGFGQGPAAHYTFVCDMSHELPGHPLLTTCCCWTLAPRRVWLGGWFGCLPCDGDLHRRAEAQALPCCPPPALATPAAGWLPLATPAGALSAGLGALGGDGTGGGRKKKQGQGGQRQASQEDLRAKQVAADAAMAALLVEEEEQRQTKRPKQGKKGKEKAGAVAPAGKGRGKAATVAACGAPAQVRSIAPALAVGAREARTAVTAKERWLRPRRGRPLGRHPQPGTRPRRGTSPCCSR